jgi:SAM-dependent methyltransferase
MGIDGRQMHIDQANFVFKVNEIEENRYKFVVGNIFDLDLLQFGNFDIVFCLGFFHHVSKHMVLLEKIAQVNSDILLLDTRVSRIPGAYMVIQYESTEVSVNALDYSLTMVPTKRAVFGMAEQFGYTAVMLRPRRHHSAVKDYRVGRRRAFLCSKKTNLSNLPVEVEKISLTGELLDIAILGAHWLGRPVRRLHLL